MRKLALILISISSGFISFGQWNEELDEKRVMSTIDSSYSPELVLIQEFTINSPIESVWNAYTTKEGWESWAAAIADIDLKVNGTIKTNYNKAGEIGDASTITLHILNYVPKRLLTLQAELTKNFPDFMKEDEKDMYNVILFKEIDLNKTKVFSYGIGYKNNEDYRSLMQFFIQGNEQSYKNLITYLETGIPSVEY